MDLLSWEYRIAGKHELFRQSGDKPLVMPPEAVNVFLELLFPGDAPQWSPGDFAEVKFSADDGLWIGRLSGAGELFLDVAATPDYLDLGHLLAVRWGVTSRVQFKNLLFRNDGEITEVGRKFLGEITTLDQQIAAITGELIGKLEPELSRVRAFQREIAQVNAVRRLLWSQVCRFQEQTEKFSAAMQTIVGNPVKPELVAEINQIKEEIGRLSDRLDRLAAEIAELSPLAVRYRRYLTFSVLGAVFIGGAIIGLVLDLMQPVSTGIGLLGLFGMVTGLIGLKRTKEPADRYYSCQDDTLDDKTALRRARKELKKALAGQDETELFERIAAQEEANQIRTGLDYQLDRYTKGWQRASAKLAQDQLARIYTKVFQIVEQQAGNGPARKLLDLLHQRQRQLVEVEAATFREEFWTAGQAVRKGSEQGRERIADLLIPDQAPVFWCGNEPDLPTSNNVRQFIVVG